MSQAQIEQFASRVKNDPSIFNKLTAGTQTPDEFIDKAIAIGAESGFSFTRDEADTWIKAQIAAKANGELSDLQLEGVAGGKGNTTSQPGWSNSPDGKLINGIYDVVNWFKSW